MGEEMKMKSQENADFTYFEENAIPSRKGLTSEHDKSLFDNKNIYKMKRNNRHKILCIGGANIDRKIQLEGAIVLGTSNPSSSSISCGGVARNIAENLGRLGCTSSLLTLVGDDPEGTWLLNRTKEFIDISPSELMEGKKTGSYTAILDQDGEMKVAFADMGIYDDLPVGFIEKKCISSEKYDLVILDTNFPAKSLEKVKTRCLLEKIPLCIAPVSVPKICKIPDSLDGVTWMIANQSEAEVLGRMKISSEGDFFRVAEAILAKGAERVVITRGDNGLIYLTKKGEAGVLMAPSIIVKDVTGAGDALISGIMYAFLKGLEIEDSCKIGLTCSVIALSSMETVSSSLNQHNLQEAFRRYFSKGVESR